MNDSQNETRREKNDDAKNAKTEKKTTTTK